MLSRIRNIFIVSIMFIPLGVASVSLAKEGTWTKKGDMPNPRYAYPPTL